jgi:hypothetical protein
MIELLVVTKDDVNEFVRQARTTIRTTWFKKYFIIYTKYVGNDEEKAFDKSLRSARLASESFPSAAAPARNSQGEFRASRREIRTRRPIVPVLGGALAREWRVPEIGGLDRLRRRA